MLKLKDLWLVRTSNNANSYDADDFVFETDAMAKVEARARAKERRGDRTDYIVVPLWKVIEDYANAMADNAMTEG